MLTANYHPYVGGAEGQARSLARDLHRRGVPVYVITRRLPALANRETIDGIPVERLAAWGSGPFSAIIFTISSFFYFLIHTACYSVIHVHLASSPALAAALAGRLLNKRVIVKLGGGRGVGEIALSKKTLLGRLKLTALGFLKPVLAAVNTDILEEIPGSGLERLRTCIVPNGVDLGIFRPAEPDEKKRLRQELGWRPGMALLSTSRLTQDKHVGDLLREFLGVWAAVASHSDARLYIAGSGEQEPLLRAASQSLGTERSVFFLGARNDVERLYRAADALLLPTASEGMSNALLEAMACGLAVLATRVTGTRDIVHDGTNGLLYEPGNRAESAEQLKRLIEDPSLARRLGRAARATAENFSIEKTSDLWLRLYRCEEVYVQARVWN